MGHEPEQLDEVARILVRALGDQASKQHHPVWVQLLDVPGGEVEMAVSSDAGGLLGRLAPPACFAVGVVATGRVRSLDPAMELPARYLPGRAGDVRLACLVERSGTVGWHMRLPDGSQCDRSPEEGRMLDVLRRCLELPTPAPGQPAGRLHTIAWIGALTDASSARRRRLTWAEAVAAHPQLAGEQPCSADAPAEERILVAAAGENWESLRLAVASGLGGPEMPPPPLAAWMDEGMFSRWVLDALPPLESLIDTSRALLVPAAARRLAHVARRVG